MELHPFVVILLLSTTLKTRFRLLGSSMGVKTASGKQYDYCFTVADEHIVLDPEDHNKVLRTNIQQEMLLQVKIPESVDLSEMEFEVLQVVHTDRRGEPQQRDTSENPHDARSVMTCYKCFKSDNVDETGRALMLCNNNDGQHHHACCLVCHVSCDGLETDPEVWYCHCCRIQKSRVADQ